MSDSEQPNLANSPGYVGTFGYTGQRYEPAVDLYDYDARWYEPRLARFLQPDPLVPEPFRPQSLNRYSYVLNDPVSRIDPSGYTSTCSLESPGSCPGGTIGSSYGGGDYRGDDFDYGSADAGRGPGSLLRYYRPRDAGGGNGARPQRPEHIWLADFLGWEDRFAESQAVQAAGGKGARLQPVSQAQQLQDSRIIDPRHPLARSMIAAENRSGGSDAFNEVMSEVFRGALATDVAIAGALAVGPTAAGALARTPNAALFASSFSVGLTEGFNLGVPGGPRMFARIPGAPLAVNAGLISGRITGKAAGFVGRFDPVSFSVAADRIFGLFR